MNKGKYVYIVTNSDHTLFETAISEHVLIESWKCKAGIHPFTRQIGKNTEIVYYKYLTNFSAAVELIRELKSKPKEQLVELIKSFNPSLKDIYYDVWIVG